MRDMDLVPPRRDGLEVLLPAPAVLLVILLFLILPMLILTGESLLAPVVEYSRAMLMPVNAGMSYTALPLQLLIKIAIFALFTFTGVTLLLLKISCLYHEVWSGFLQPPDPRHPPYHPDQQESMIALFNWNIFRWYKTMGPVIGWACVTILVGALGFWLFNAFTDFGFLSFQLQFSLSFFAVSVFGLFTVIAFFRGLWGAFTSILGDVAAITEPERPTGALYDRARRLAFGSPWSVILYPLYFAFYLAVLIQIVLLVANYDIQDLLSFRPDIWLIFGFEFATLVVGLMLTGMKFLTYHDALARYYQRYYD